MGVAIQLAAGTYADSGEIPDIALMGVHQLLSIEEFGRIEVPRK